MISLFGFIAINRKLSASTQFIF